MPSAGDGVAWDETIPTDSGEIDDTGTELREVKKAVRIRLNKEHVDFAGASVGGEHEKGSAKAFYQATYPTLRPDGTTTLDASDAGRILVRSDGPWMEVFDGADFQKILPPDGSLTAAKTAAGFLYAMFNYAYYTERLSGLSTGAGTFSANAWRTRPLTNEETDVGAIGALAGNEVTLQAGTYRTRASAPAYQVDYHQIRIQNVTDGVTYALGDMAVSFADSTVTRSEAACEFTLTSAKAFQVQHYCKTTKATDGFGKGPGDFGVNWITTKLEIWKIK